MKKTLLFAALFGCVLVAIAGFELNTVLNERVRILSSPTAGAVSQCNGIAMTEWLCFMELGVRAEWRWLFWRWVLITFSVSTLLALIYIVAGVCGGPDRLVAAPCRSSWRKRRVEHGWTAAYPRGWRRGSADVLPATHARRQARLVYIPFAIAESTGLSAKSSPNMPWIMYPGTPKAHIMFVPTM